MSSRRGFTLVELVIVIVIFGFMMALGAPAFSAWQRKHTVEDQIEKLYNNLQFARMKAYTEKVTWGLWWNSSTNPFSTYDIRRNNTTPPEFSASLKFPVNSSNSSGWIYFDTRGFTTTWTTFAIAPSYGASIDCVSVSNTRIRIGRMSVHGSQTTCDPK